jgi:site-specific recombinase XerD
MVALPVPVSALEAEMIRLGYKDSTMVYDTGARVQEIADLTVRDIRLQNPAMASLTGKGRKTRHVPLDGGTITLLAAYLEEHRLDEPGRDSHPVFYGQHRARLSRGGIAWIIRKYQAQIHDPLLAGATISPHILRHYVEGRVMWPAASSPLVAEPRVLVPAT